jgi:hypothetical protein
LHHWAQELERRQAKQKKTQKAKEDEQNPNINIGTSEGIQAVPVSYKTYTVLLIVR